MYGHTYYPSSTYRLKVVLRDELEQVQEIDDDVILDPDESDPRKIGTPGFINPKLAEVTEDYFGLYHLGKS